MEMKICTACGDAIEPNIFNMCDFCLEFADNEPEAFEEYVLA